MSLSYPYIEPGHKYKLLCTVANFLETTVTSAPIEIEVSDKAFPSVSIDGAAVRTMYTTSTLSLFARVSESVGREEASGVFNTRPRISMPRPDVRVPASRVAAACLHFAAGLG